MITNQNLIVNTAYVAVVTVVFLVVYVAAATAVVTLNTMFGVAALATNPAVVVGTGISMVAAS